VKLTVSNKWLFWKTTLKALMPAIVAIAFSSKLIPGFKDPVQANPSITHPLKTKSSVNWSKIVNQAPKISDTESRTRYFDKHIRSYLIEGGDVNAGDVGLKDTPLHYAADYNLLEVAELLIAKGAIISSQDLSGATPLHRAALNNSREVANLLIAKKADVDARDKIGATPLHYTSELASIEVARLLLDKGADVNSRDTNRQTPLHKAVSPIGKSDISLLKVKAFIELLIDKGANINAQDIDCRTPAGNAGLLHPEVLIVFEPYKPKLGFGDFALYRDFCSSDSSQ
jgi:Ankyrin repeats (3 copies)/Ankyrin repeats (many copies)